MIEFIGIGTCSSNDNKPIRCLLSVQDGSGNAGRSLRQWWSLTKHDDQLTCPRIVRQTGQDLCCSNQIGIVDLLVQQLRESLIGLCASNLWRRQVRNLGTEL